MPSTTTIPSWRENITLGIAILGAGLGIFNAWNARRVNRLRKRQESPHFVNPEMLIWHSPQPKMMPPTGMFGFPPGGGGNVPDNYADGEKVNLRMYNTGGEARFVEAESLSGLSIEHEYRDSSDSKTLTVKYGFSSARRGRPERFQVTYETVSGEKGWQIIEHPHGHSEARRVEIG